MAAGLSTPLHLAASLLAVFTAAGLAMVVVSRPATRPPRRRQHLSDLAVAVGAVLIAVGHGLSGALANGGSETVGALRAVGLGLLALGLSPGRLAQLTGPPVLVPVAPLPVALLGGLAGLVGGLRVLAGGRRAVLVAVALVAWGAAETLGALSVTAASWATVGGSLALGGWLWQASASRLLAKVVTAFLASVLAVVVLLAGVVGRLQSGQLIDQELARLADFSEELADEIAVDWPREATDATRPLSTAVETLLRLRESDVEDLADIKELSFRNQDFFAIFDAHGGMVSYADDPALRDGAFPLQIAGTGVVENLLSPDFRDAEGGDLVSVGGTLVALGGVRLHEERARPEDPPAGALVAGRLVDELWAARAADSPGVNVLGVLVEVGGQPAVTSLGVQRDVARAVVDALAGGRERAVFNADGRVLYAGASDLFKPGTPELLGRIVTLSSVELLSQIERSQARRLFLLALAGALLAGAVAAVVSRRLVAPIRGLTAAAAAVREGDFDVAADVDTPDEVGQLGRTFNEMTASLSAQAAQLREAAAVQTRLRARLEALTASMSDALVAVGADGRVIAFNPAAERLVGRDVAGALERPLEEVLVGSGPADQSAAQALGGPTSEQVVAVQLLLQRPDGRYVPTAATAAPVHDATGTVLGRVLVLRDVTREAEIERMKTEFLSNVSHELRTPLTPIKGYAEILARKDVGPTATRHFAEQILGSTARLERIVGMIVDFAALDSGRVELRREPTELSQLIDEVLDRWRGRHPDRDFRRRLAKSLPPVLVDPGMLRRCLDELLDNAVKFSPGGEPVSISAVWRSASSNGRGTVRLSVRDRGVGIEPDTAASIFRDFYQVDASDTRHYGGLGLGLALVRRIVDGVGGDAAVESEPGKGSTFHLLLPVADDLGAGGGRNGPTRRDHTRVSRHLGH